MYQKGDYIVYGTRGVCLVEDVAPLLLAEAEKGRIYYKLIPKYMKSSTIYAPVDTDKTVIRPLLNKEEAKEVLARVENLNTLWITNEKQREADYKKALKSGDVIQWCRVLKTLYLRKKERYAEGKLMTCVDERYFHLTQTALFGELSIPLEQSIEEIECCFFEKCGIDRKK